jgi:hypothetical protein
LPSATSSSRPFRRRFVSRLKPQKNAQIPKSGAKPAARTVSEHELEICFQHSGLCQTGLPYRKPGDNVRR